MNSSPSIYFVIGTRAQFIKVAPVMRKMRELDRPYQLIYTAQHQENIEEILSIYDLPNPDFVMYRKGEANTKSSFLRWFMTIFLKVLFQSKRYLRNPGIVLTHGDTFTAWLAALMGKRANCLVGHIESGCRSFNLFSPFPEELSRLLTFSLTDIYFCTDEWAINNLKHFKGKKVNIGANTMLDGVRYALQYPEKTQFPFKNFPFIVVSIHRFENIFTARFTKVILPSLCEIARKHHLIFILHPTTRERLKALGLYDELNSNSNITLQERVGFIDWINLCNKAEFVITDGGSNQEELSYLGVPTLLFRNESERHEGLEHNIVISRFDPMVIRNFVENPNQYRRELRLNNSQPSETIVQTIVDLRR